MSQGPEQLTQEVNEIQYLDYSGVGWLKAVPLTCEALGSFTPADGRKTLAGLLDRVGRSPADAAVHRELIRFFLAEWICYQTPEDSCAWWWSEDVSRFQPVSRPTAVSVIDAIVTSSAAAREEWLGSAGHDGERARMATRYDVDYANLVDLFANRLFSGSQSYFYALTPRESTVERGTWMSRILGRRVAPQPQPAATGAESVIGINAAAIGMFWQT